jgi:hypothetical protein
MWIPSGFVMKSEFLCIFQPFLPARLFLATLPCKMATRSSQLPALHVVPMNNTSEVLADLSVDEISIPPDMHHAIHPRTYKSSDVHMPTLIPFGTGTPTPFIFGPTSPAQDQHLKTILCQLMVNLFTFMNGCIKDLTQ